MNDSQILILLQEAKRIGEDFLKKDAIKYSANSDNNEDVLISFLNKAGNNLGMNFELIHHKGHAFPDVTIKNTGYGIELKGARSSKKFNGNSVFGSTLVPNLKKIFLFYWISSEKFIGYKDYFECIDTPVVTHSPRFRLDPNLAPENRMFGSEPHQVGTVEDIIFSGESIDSDFFGFARENGFLIKKLKNQTN